MVVNRPRRVYYDEKKDKYFYLVKGKRKYLKIKEGMSQKQIQKVNLVNIIGNLEDARRRKPRRLTKRLRFKKKITEDQPERKGVFIASTTLPVRPEQLPSKERDFTKPTKVETPDIPKWQDLEKGLKEQIKILREEKKNFQDFIKSKERMFQPESKENNEQKESKEDDEPKKKKRALDIRIIRNYLIQQPASPLENIENALDDLEMQVNLIQLENIFPNNRVDENMIKRAVESLKNKRDTILNSTKPDEVKQEELNQFKKDIQEDIKEVEEEDISGSGRGDDMDGLYSDEIQNHMKKKVKRIIPVVAMDELDTLLDDVKYLQDEYMAVINTDVSSGPGKHWVCIYIDNKDDFPSAEYFDPLGDPCPKPVRMIMKKLCQKMNPENMFLFKENLIKNQASDTETCGHFVMKFLQDRHAGVPFSKATYYDKYMEKCDNDFSGEGEKKIKKFSSYM